MIYMGLRLQTSGYCHSRLQESLVTAKARVQAHSSRPSYIIVIFLFIQCINASEKFVCCVSQLLVLTSPPLNLSRLLSKLRDRIVQEAWLCAPLILLVLTHVVHTLTYTHRLLCCRNVVQATHWGLCLSVKFKQSWTHNSKKTKHWFNN